MYSVVNIDHVVSNTFDDDGNGGSIYMNNESLLLGNKSISNRAELDMQLAKEIQSKNMLEINWDIK